MFAAASKTASSSSAPSYIEDVFSTYLYSGNSSTQTITNGLDISGKGGLVWLKMRSNAQYHYLFDTARGPLYSLSTNTTDQSYSIGNTVTAFNSNGFNLGLNSATNGSGDTFVSWSFRKQAKFFDVVTYTGNGANRTIAHNLGSVPGCIIVKRTDITADWQVYHRSLANTEYMVLNTTAAKATGATRWNSTTPTSTEFSLGTDATVNANGGTYVAYLFAHDAGGFGAAGTDNVISCGSYTGNGSTSGPEINLGYEPQYVLIKNASATGYWFTFDSMRGIATGGTDALLWPNVADAEANSTDNIDLTATGFRIKNSAASINGNGNTLIYIAIRRGPMKTPTSGTSVFSANKSAASAGTQITTNFVVDMQIQGYRPGDSENFAVADRLRGVSSTTTQTIRNLKTSSTAAESTTNGSQTRYWNNTGFQQSAYLAGADGIFWNFGRAPGFMDVVCYTGTLVNNTQVAHNLNAVPELIIFKSRNAVGPWPVWSTSFSVNGYLQLQATSAINYSSPLGSSPTSSVIYLGDTTLTNGSGTTYVAYLFASCPGVSKVGTYTGTGTSQTIDCGFPSGVRFVLIKRVDVVGDWFLYDTTRGMTSGNDPYILLNSVAAEVTGTNYVETVATGFRLIGSNAGTNANTRTYLYLAIA